MQRLQKYESLFRVLQQADPKMRTAIIRSAPEPFIQTLIEVVLNFLHGNIHTSPSLVTKLKKHKKKLRQLASYRSKRGLGKVRKDLVTQKGGFLFLLPLLGTIAMAATAAAAPAIAKRAARSATNSALDTVGKRITDVVNKL